MKIFFKKKPLCAIKVNWTMMNCITISTKGLLSLFYKQFFAKNMILNKNKMKFCFKTKIAVTANA